jgi:hypothetical protein
MLEVQVSGMHRNVVGLNRLMGFQLSPSDSWISNDYIDINKQK